jgi:hypothetical protein
MEDAMIKSICRFFRCFVGVSAALFSQQAFVAQIPAAPAMWSTSSYQNIPFGSSATYTAGYTFAEVIPASLLNPIFRQVTEVSFPPSATGSWSCNTVFMALGHLPNPIPCPFSFPSPAGSTIGSFLDLTVLWDSAVQGPFTWPWVADSWSSMGFAAAGGTNFVWNGINDVGFFVTFQNSVVTTGGIRTASIVPPARMYAAGYQASVTTITACNTGGGLFTQLSCVPLFPFNVTTTGVADVLITAVPSVAVPGSTEGFTFASFATPTPLGGGWVFGLTPDALLLSIVSIPAAIGNPLHYVVWPGAYPDVPFAIGPGGLIPFIGMTIDFVQASFGPGFTLLHVSNAARVTF